MADEHLMSVDEFNRLVSEWAMNIRSQARGTLASTKGSGKLSSSIKEYMYGKKQGATYKINFDFLKYGVFRSYGVGRGYVMANGTVVKGYRVYSGKGSKGESTVNLMKKGYTLKEIKRMKRVSRFAEVKRTPLDWFNTHVSNEIETLADLVQNYYGDDALRNMMANIDKIKITKK